MPRVLTTIRIRPMPPPALHHLILNHATQRRNINKIPGAKKALSIHAVKCTTTPPTHLYTPTMTSPAHVLPTPSTKNRDNSYPSTSTLVKRSKPTSTDTTSTAQEDTTPSTLPYLT